ncbi:MAG: hypothetical protein F6K58_26130 [Symploca sp. SIO2E9]|nr:hypothetical protein [Symploca sp. SIO2E9]
MQAAQTIDSPYYKSNALSAIAQASAQLEEHKAAKEFLEESLQAAQTIDSPYYKSNALSAIAQASAQLEEQKAAKEFLEQSLQAAQTIEDSHSKSDALSAIAQASAQLEEHKAAKEFLEESLQAAQTIDSPYYKSNALSAIVSASAQLQDQKAVKELLQESLQAAEAANASSVLAEIAIQYAQQYNWGKALRALRNCPESERVSAMAKILTLWAEKKNLRLIDGAVVLEVKVSGTPKNYTFNVSLHSPTKGCNQYTDWWEVLSEDGELLYRHVFEKSHVEEQPFESSGKPVKIQSDQEVIVRAHMNNQDDDNNIGYKAMQAWKGTVEKGFKSIRLPENFAASVAKEEPQPRKCKEGK